MRKPDIEVQEVVCSETGKPMPKIPLWMAGMKVKFISDEARQKHPVAPALADIEPVRKSLVSGEDIEDIKAFEDVAEVGETEGDFEDIEAEPDEIAGEEFEE
ncbi:MAG TPA: hypothetical protein VFB21_10860 [Chthonomonadaceae bacterium]|nr:hypothetical protein [Chthonomonadaceae bacterium]